MKPSIVRYQVAVLLLHPLEMTAPFMSHVTLLYITMVCMRYGQMAQIDGLTRRTMRLRHQLWNQMDQFTLVV